MNLLQEIFSEQFIYSLGWTLVHSLWQGALIGLIIAVAMILLHKYTAKLRYFIYGTGLFVMAGIAVVTFISSYTTYKPDHEINTSLANNTLSTYSIQSTGIKWTDTKESLTFNSATDIIVAYCREHFPLFVTIWLLGMFAMMLRFMGGYALVRRYKYHRVKPVLGDWERRFHDLAHRINLNKNVRLIESALIRVPMAIGYLKPVVLLPLGALNGVPAQQMEAILVHELAHIKRRDYLVNLLQSVLEVIFFYHPVVWWLSNNIRIERENICDDIAITITGNTMEFAKALTNIQEMNLGSPALAAGLSGKNKNRLVNRIRRIVGKPNVKPGFAEGFIAASILVVSLIGLSAAAMITYPAEHELPAPLTFDDQSIVTPGFIYYHETAILPDTTEKLKEKQYKEQLQKQQQEKQEQWQLQQQKVEQAMIQHQEQMNALMQEEMKVLEEKLKAMDEEMNHLMQSEEYEKALQKANIDREKHLEQMKMAREAYEKAMQSSYLRGAAYWTLPRVFIHEGEEHFIPGDSLAWSKYPDNFYFHADSLTDIFYGQWPDHRKNYEKLKILQEEGLFELQEELAEMEELMELREAEPFEYDYDYDYDYDFDYDYDHAFHPNFMVLGSVERIVAEELQEDGLIDHGREYVVLIGKKQMLINGEKQTRTVFKKYRRLVDSVEEPWQFNENDEVRIHIRH